MNGLRESYVFSSWTNINPNSFHENIIENIIEKGIDPNINRKWAHHLFGMPLNNFDMNTFVSQLTDYIQGYHYWENESQNWIDAQVLIFGDDYQNIVCSYLQMEEIRSTSYFNTWWTGTQTQFDYIIQGLIENGRLPNSTIENPAYGDCL